METEGRNKSATRELESIDVPVDRMRAKPNGNRKTEMWNLEWRERSCQETGVGTNPSAIWKWRWEIMGGKQPSCWAGQCGGSLIRRRVPLPAALDPRPAKRTGFQSHQPSESCLSRARLRHLCGGFGFPAWGCCGSGVGRVLCPCDLHVKASLNKLLNPKLPIRLFKVCLRRAIRYSSWWRCVLRGQR